MRTCYGFELSETCTTCRFRRDGFFCQLAPAELRDFDAIKHVAAYRPDVVLFSEQQTPTGFFLLCEGEVKLSISSSEGRKLILRIAKPGDAIGMWAALSGAPYEATAECLRPCQLAFVSSADYRGYLRRHPAVFERAANFLGQHYKNACDQLAAVGLKTTVPERVAKFLLDWSAKMKAPGNGSPFTLSVSHEDMAEHVGATRESVTRTLSKFRKSGLIERHGKTFMIPNREALVAFALCQDRTQRSGLGPQLVRLAPADLQHKPGVIQWSERQRRANRRERA